MKLIKINTDHYIIVDDSEIKEGDFKITYSTNIALNEVYYIPLSEVKELIGEVDVEKKAYRFRRDYQDSFEGMNECIMNDAIHRQEGFIAGYNQALEDNKHKKYTEEDIREAILLYSAWITGGTPSLRIAETSEQRIVQIIQSLQPKTEWEVEFVDGKLKLKKL